MSNQEPWSKKLPQGYQDLLRSIDDFFQHTYNQFQENPLFLPPIPVRILEKEELWIAEVELPGIDKKQIKLDFHRQTIRIQVSMDEESIYTDDQKGVVERRGHSQLRQRIIHVPFLFNDEDVKATLKNGLLRIAIPNKRKHITIE